ncbi:MAG: hypothetical protein RMZ69_15150 [Nostoc sp. ChiQUE01a]|nr:hypothetical protein [Nostoc sp. SerVER01]MDZ8025868.1 hypothetical protein [Nostoc sp. DedQUE11]MDZ8071757.1 hypothetical protein [Nostoc sp. DedQUE01]MDZ8082666.1 hypothetical protein [Nostoc sp. DcaGUA01]MDZ8238495.1 hypothetical protein [Nostoc sp. ChiQUE01a]
MRPTTIPKQEIISIATCDVVISGIAMNGITACTARLGVVINST